MRFLVDECTGPAVARWLEERDHDVFSVYDEAPGIPDEEVLQRAYREQRILVTNDKDFGEKVYPGTSSAQRGRPIASRQRAKRK